MGIIRQILHDGEKKDGEVDHIAQQNKSYKPDNRAELYNEGKQVENARTSLAAARIFQRSRHFNGVNRVDLYVEDVNSAWLEVWGENEVDKELEEQS